MTGECSARHIARARARARHPPTPGCAPTFRGAARPARRAPPPPWQRDTHVFGSVGTRRWSTSNHETVPRPCRARNFAPDDLLSTRDARTVVPGSRGPVRGHRPLRPKDERPAPRGPEGESRPVLALGRVVWPTGGLGPGGGGASAGSSRDPAERSGGMDYSSVPQGPNLRERIRGRGETNRSSLRSDRDSQIISDPRPQKHSYQIGMRKLFVSF